MGKGEEGQGEGKGRGEEGRGGLPPNWGVWIRQWRRGGKAIRARRGA